MSNSQVLSAQEALNQAQGRVLLINPPVIDSRYPWIKWNQPLDLLKLGALLSQTHGCQVKLFDFMLPSPKGTVPQRKSKLEDDLTPDEPIRWQFGQPWDRFDAYLDRLVSFNWTPDSVWITTLTSFWWQAVPLVANRIKNKLGRPAVVLYGNYPTLETAHAAQFCPDVDVIVQGHADLTSCSANFSLYGDRKLNFCALDLHSPDPLAEIACALDRGTTHFCFFNENLFESFDTHLKPILEEVVNRRWDLRFHGICGVQTQDFPLDHAQLLADAHFSELHFELALGKDGTVDEPLYRAVMRACEGAGFVTPRGAGWESRGYYFSGFLWVGRPKDDLDKLVWNALKLLQLVGMVIPKPYSPTPGTNDYDLLALRRTQDNSFQVDRLEPENLSPHRLPFAGLNGLEKGDYEDLYRMTAFLNRKVRAHTFDFLGETFLAKVIRESLAGRRWDLS
jgi:hypothetical protein